ncbi:hypothetical protein K4L44_00875 [Halosquirtibacter laminarini]|uniref:Uncharacterized protein n=1 Tax=Halosquirtibacter laminarini TaxID=3374600 RepID=A0AC61NFQ4_9BACT|nr:hypothetical protein K4L44_00875 [Prolixibacteraceae bacterium]
MGGIVSQPYIDQQVALQKKILKRMKELNIQPIVPAFWGMIPRSAKAKFPNAKIIDQGKWAGGFDRPLFFRANRLSLPCHDQYKLY